MKKILRALVFLTLAGLVVIGAVRCKAESDQQTRTNGAQVVAGQMGKPGDLSGDWTTKPDAKIKFVAEIQAGTILIHMIEKGDTLAYYYGTFTMPDAQNVFKSTAIDDGKMVWSNSTEKDFLWQDGSLIFTFEIAGVKTAVELVREDK